MPCSTTCRYHPHPPWKFAWSFIWRNLNRLHPLMLCAKFGWLLETWLWILRWRCEQFTDRRSDVLTYKLRMTGDQKSSFELSAQLAKNVLFPDTRSRLTTYRRFEVITGPGNYYVTHEQWEICGASQSFTTTLKHCIGQGKRSVAGSL